MITGAKIYGPKNIKAHMYILVVNDNFSKFGWTVQLKKRPKQKKIHLKTALKPQENHQVKFRKTMDRKLQAKILLISPIK